MIRLASKQAIKSTYYYRLGAVITKGRRVLSTGYNKISHCPVNTFRNSRHAEMDAILKLLRKKDGLSSLSGAIIHVSRVNPNGNPALAKPCNKCLDLIKSVGIKKIIFTTDSGTEEIKL